ncbi:AsnC family transcriptional regulator [Bacterioplanes sanyensis]|uniref:AsnC family transcriptional regulator n=1 Tax=Bacterioplanes sanyensis TaxID=1249553 RepID=A0A222FMN6_9GAMM|nr:Lrp/AsnC family transcriptional regulator [Bacterioplanes sanyensis]ASP39641.1 AsnC family transcriptional regulator [Bacterioplanes sanyensis]
MESLDRIDRQILNCLQRDGQLTAQDIADRVGLSPSPCARRIRRLQHDGWIKRYRAELDRERLQLDITVFVHVRLSQHQDAIIDQFEQTVGDMAEVISCHTVSGAFDYLLQVVARDLRHYESWVRRLQKLPNVNTIDSSFAIREVKAGGPLPL